MYSINKSFSMWILRKKMKACQVVSEVEKQDDQTYDRGFTSLI